MSRTRYGLVLAVALLAGCSAAATPSPSPSPATVAVEVTFDGQTCTYSGPAIVAPGTFLVFDFKNTPEAVSDSTTKGAVTIGSDLVVIETIPGTTLDTVEASLAAPAGTTDTWPAPAWAVDLAAYGIGPSATVGVEATGAAYYVGCHYYWDKAFGPTYAAYPATVVQVGS